MAVELNSRLAAVAPSAIRAIHDRKRPSSLDLGLGQPSLRPDPEPFEAATEWVRRHGCPYSPNGGLAELRQQAAVVYGGPRFTDAENVCVTNGSQEAIYLAVKALAEPGRDEVLVTDPTYPSYYKCCELEGITWRAVRLHPDDGFCIRADALLEALTPSTRLIILGSPANPTGAVIGQREAHKLAKELSARPGPPVTLVVDEVYRELVFTPETYASLSAIYPDTVAVHSLSKSCALTGLRLGFFIGPARYVEAAVRAHALMLLSTSTFGQRVALEILRQPERLRVHHSWYERQRARMLQRAAATGLEVLEPQGAFYALVRLPEAWRDDCDGAALALFEQYDVVTVPGSVFGRATKAFLRITWAAQEETLNEGLGRIAELFAKTR